MVSLLASLTAANASRIIVASILLGLAVIVLSVGLWYYRKRLMEPTVSSGEPWTFEDLRRLRDSGNLTEEEYEALRSALKNAYRGDLSNKKSTTTTGIPTGSDDRGPDFDLKKTPPS